MGLLWGGFGLVFVQCGWWSVGNGGVVEGLWEERFRGILCCAVGVGTVMVVSRGCRGTAVSSVAGGGFVAWGP